MLRRHPERLRRFGRALSCALAALAAACQPGQDDATPPRAEARPQLGLLTSLPIYWGEPAELGDLLDGSSEQHWLRTRLEEEYGLVPLDVLGQSDGRPNSELDMVDRLIVAQPRALTPADNVALDRWVRDGGRLLLVLDPLMTEHSDYPIGDKRRFNDVALIPPVLARWGLALRYTEGVPPGEVEYRGAAVTVAEFGTISRVVPADEGGRADCAVEAEGVIARCRIGRGTALVMADAAFLNRESRDRESGGADAILAAAFGPPL